MKTYFELKHDVCQKLIQHFSSVFIKTRDESTKPSLTEIAEKEYIKSHSKSAKKMEQSVLSTTDDTIKSIDVSNKAANQ